MPPVTTGWTRLACWLKAPLVRPLWLRILLCVFLLVFAAGCLIFSLGTPLDEESLSNFLLIIALYSAGVGLLMPAAWGRLSLVAWSVIFFVGCLVIPSLDRRMTQDQNVREVCHAVRGNYVYSLPRDLWMMADSICGPRGSEKWNHHIDPERVDDFVKAVFPYISPQAWQ